jgi:SPP1 gp7 family putative phage head morphogenesis protein
MGVRIMRATTGAYRAGRDVQEAFRQAWLKDTETLTDSMVACFLMGRVKVRDKFDAMQFSLYDNTIEFLRARSHLSPQQLAVLRRRYNSQALKVLSHSSAYAERKLQRTVTRVVSEGMHVNAGVNALHKTFNDLGITPANKFQLEGIYRTQTHMAYQAGRWQALQDPDIADLIWGFKYVTVGDDRVRSEHADLDGLQAKKDDPVWGTHWPPNGWACRCQVLEITRPRKTKMPDALPEPQQGFAFNPGMIDFVVRPEPRPRIVTTAEEIEDVYGP